MCMFVSTKRGSRAEASVHIFYKTQEQESQESVELRVSKYRYKRSMDSLTHPDIL